ncbi:hypothetical protein F9L16_03825 [Agarivorans sp. B2Z047]|nr:hypothetical protein [Agarivorans sp. B2Z047]
MWIKWSGLFTNLMTPTVALFALFFAYRQLASHKRESRSATAHNIYNQYLSLCINNPSFANGMDKPDKQCQIYGQYCWFVSTILFTFEQLLETQSENEKWEKTIKSQLLIHNDLLIRSSTIKNNQWSDKLTIIIDSINRKA